MYRLEDILQHLECKKIGDLYRALCPFHPDRNNPNLTIYCETESFYCFSCGAVGDFDKLYCKLAGIDYKVWKRQQPPEINLEKKQVNYKKQVLLIAGRLFHEELQKKPMGEVMAKMRRFDNIMKDVSIIKEKEVSKYIKTYFCIGG